MRINAMHEAVSHFVPDYRDQPARSRFWRTDTPRGIELVAGYVGVRRQLRREARSLAYQAVLYVLFVLGMWWWAAMPRPFPWSMLLFGLFLIIPGWWLFNGIYEGRRGLAVRIEPEGLCVHRQDALTSRWRYWRRERIARADVNWEGWIVLRDPQGKAIGKFGGVPSRVDMLWLARLIRGRFALSE